MIKEIQKNILDKFFLVRDKQAKEKTLQLLEESKWKITDARTIPYDSPTGAAYVGVAKSPLQKVEKGFGFKGVLLQTDNREFVQCHECGKWLRILSMHVKRMHKVSSREYKEKFGLPLYKGFIPDALSYKKEEASRKLWADKKYREARTIALRTTSKKAMQASLLTRRGRKPTVSFENEKGTCELQIKFRLLEYIKQYKDLPSQTQKGEGRKIAKVLHRRHGSINKGFEYYGLPMRHRTGTNVELISPNKEQYFFNYNKPNYSKQAVFDWMYKNCPVLQIDPKSLLK